MLLTGLMEKYLRHIEKSLKSRIPQIQWCFCRQGGKRHSSAVGQFPHEKSGFPPTLPSGRAAVEAQLLPWSCSEKTLLREGEDGIPAALLQVNVSSCVSDTAGSERWAHFLHLPLLLLSFSNVTFVVNILGNLCHMELIYQCLLLQWIILFIVGGLTVLELKRWIRAWQSVCEMIFVLRSPWEEKESFQGWQFSHLLLNGYSVLYSHPYCDGEMKTPGEQKLTSLEATWYVPSLRSDNSFYKTRSTAVMRLNVVSMKSGVHRQTQ